MNTLSPALLEKKAVADFSRMFDQHVLVHEVYLVEPSGERLDRCVKFEQPILVRIRTSYPEDIVHWTDDEWLDPVWLVEPLEKRPELEGYEQFYIYGHSYSTTGEVAATTLRIIQ